MPSCTMTISGANDLTTPRSKLPSFCNCPSPYPVPFENKVVAQVKILREIATEMCNKKTKQTMDKGVTKDKYTCWCHARDLLNAKFEISN